MLSTGSERNRIYLRGEPVKSQGGYRINLRFYILNDLYSALNAEFWKECESKRPPTEEMIIIDFEHVADKVRKSKVFPYIHDHDSLNNVMNFISDNGPEIVKWVMEFENDNLALTRYKSTNWIRSSWYPLVDYTLEKIARGEDAALHYAEGLKEEDLPDLMASMARFLKKYQV